MELLIFDFLFDSPLYAMLRRNLVALTIATTGMTHHIFSVCITALRVQMMGK